MPTELTIKITREQNYGRRFIRAECLGIVVDSEPGIANEDLSDVMSKIGGKLEDRHATLKKMKETDLTDSAKAEKALLIGVLG